MFTKIYQKLGLLRKEKSLNTRLTYLEGEEEKHKTKLKEARLEIKKIKEQLAAMAEE